MDASLAGGCWASRLPRLRRLTGKLVPVTPPSIRWVGEGLVVASPCEY